MARGSNFLLASFVCWSIFDLTQAETCRYWNNGVLMSYGCPSSQMCCNRMNCCERVVPFYRLWYFWLSMALILVGCCGCCYWCRRGCRSSDTQPVVITTTTTSNNGASTTVLTRGVIVGGSQQGCSSTTQVTSYTLVGGRDPQNFSWDETYTDDWPLTQRRYYNPQPTRSTDNPQSTHRAAPAAPTVVTAQPTTAVVPPPLPVPPTEGADSPPSYSDTVYATPPPAYATLNAPLGESGGVGR